MSARAEELQPWEQAVNPLDCVEELLNANNWDFNRMTNEELVVTIQGKSCEYSLFFIWQDELEALQFCCQYELKIPNSARSKARSALTDLNESLWMGHFEITARSGHPTFRHTCLYRGMQGNASADNLENMVEIAMAQCERNYPVFALLAAGQGLNDQSISLAMMNTQGQS